MIYLDANASEPLRSVARHALRAAVAHPGNPSSIHAVGRAARRLLEDAREAIAAQFGARPAETIFTSGATESIAWAIAALGQGRRIVASAIEHDAVRAAAPRAAVIRVDRNGVADLDALAAILANGPPALVALMHANNETGVLQPVAEAGEICRRHGALLLVDAVQSAGRIGVRRDELGADALVLSSHKLGGPQGAGALLLAPEHAQIAPLISGGGQERGRRGGTPALPAIAGFAAALDEAPDPRLAGLRDRLERDAVAAGAIVLGGGAARLPNTTCLALAGVRADAQVMALDLAGIAVSAGAACSSGKVTASHVLAAMGAGPLAGQAIRVSLPWSVTRADIAAFAPAYREMAARLVPALAAAPG